MPSTSTRIAVAEIAGAIADRAVMLNRILVMLEEHEDDKQAGHAHRLLSLARIAVTRAELICCGDTYLLDDDEWDLVYCAMSVIDKMTTDATYPDIASMVPGAVRAIADEA